jgi:hypothetical protein
LTQFTCGKITTKIALGQHPILNNFNCKRRKKKGGQDSSKGEEEEERGKMALQLQERWVGFRILF